MSFLERLFDAQLTICGGLVVHGFLVWLKASRTESPDRELNEVLA